MIESLLVLLGVASFGAGILVGLCINRLPRQRDIQVKITANENTANDIRATARQRAQQLQRALRGR